MDYVDTAFKSSLTAISIGPGILGIERGVERVTRLTHLAYVEIEAFIIENLVTQMERGVLAPAVIWSDAKTLPCEPFRGLVDILFAGYPCQPFSTAGKRRGTEDPRHLYPYIERAIRIIRPRICFFENVRGHVTCGLPEVIASLEGLGYRVCWGIYSAEETGAAHKRERVFILALENASYAGIWDKIRAAGGASWIQNVRQKNWAERAIRVSTAGQLENPSGIGCGSQRTESEGFEWRTVTDDAGDKLAYSDNRHNGAKSGETEGKGSAIKSEEQWEERDKEIGEWMRSESGDGSEGMADNISHGIIKVLERRPSKQPIENGSKWVVSRPGEPQYQWESPRTVITEEAASLLGGYGKKYPESFSQEQINQVAFDGFTGTVKPSLGLSAHGYHFREDVLRALGNSVYADTAELAFKDLIRKFGIE